MQTWLKLYSLLHGHVNVPRKEVKWHTYLQINITLKH